jgi:hypothetical protein
MNVNKVEACSLFDNVSNFPIFAGVTEFLNKTFSGFMHKCPYNNIKIDNATFSLQNDKDSNNKIWSLSPFPNGIVKTVYHAYEDEDENVFTFTAFNEIYVRETVLNGKTVID